MRLFVVTVLFLEAILLATALPVGFKQQPLTSSLRPSPPSSVNSFGSSSAVSSSSAKSKLGSLFRASTNALTSISTPSSPFRCHSKPTDNPLTELYAFIESLLKRYEDRLFKKKDGPDRITFETCLAGYTKDEVSPAIYFGSMGKDVAKKVEGLLRSQEVKRGFPNMDLVTQGGVLAVVMGGGKGGGDQNGLRRRNTV